MRKTLLLLLALVGCSSSSSNTVDAPPPAIDAPPPAPPDCTTYCNTIMANCTAANGGAQYADPAHCMGSCAAMVVGTSKVTDTTGDTLGCRIYHAGAAAGSTANATLHCPHAGPGGEALNVATPAFCSGGDLCANFCALQIKTCGSTDAPIMVGTVAITPQYKNQAACEAVCKNGDATVTPAIPKFDLTHLYSPASGGNSLACRLNHWTNAAANAAVTPPTTASTGGVQAHCGHTSAAQVTGMPCFAATPTP